MNFKIGDKVIEKCSYEKKFYIITDITAVRVYVDGFKDGVQVSTGSIPVLDFVNRYEKVESKTKNMSAKDIQVGGSHYKDFKIQPMEFFIANNVRFPEASVCKYVLRHKSKNGIEDLLKAKHVIDMIIESEYGDRTGTTQG